MLSKWEKMVEKWQHRQQQPESSLNLQSQIEKQF